jgi:predicted permease
MIARFVAYMKALRGRRRAERELDEELRFHVQMETQANIERGMSPRATAREALVALGGVEQTREAVRDVHGTVLDSVAQDLRYGLRHFRRERGVVVAALLTLGLTIGLATSVYSVARSVLLRPFPYAATDRLVAVWKASPQIDFCPLPVPEVLDIKARAASVEDIGGFEREGFAILAPTGARWADTLAVTTNLLSLLGVQVLKGRTFLPEDGEPGHENVVILGEPLWREAFGADPHIVGRTVRLQAEGAKSAEPVTYLVLGIVATELQTYYPAPLRAQMYVPRANNPQDRAEQARSSPTLITIARLRDGVPVSAASSEIASVLTRSASEHPSVSLPFPSTRVVPLHEELVGRTRPAFLLLTGAAALLLLIGCVNVANLLLAGGLGRRAEIATRLALGCSHGRLFRQLITEHLVLAALGGALGLLLAAWATPVLRRLAPESIPRAGDIHLDVTALAAAVGLALFAWLCSGVLPAAAVTRGSTWNLLGTRTMAQGGRRLRGALVVAQMVLVVTLLGAAALLAKGIWRLTNAELGFQTTGVFVSAVVLPQQWWNEADPRTARFERALLNRLASDPRFGDVSIGSELPFTWGVLGRVRKSQSESEKAVPALVAAVSDRYLHLLGVRLRGGRFLDGRDEGNRGVVVVNEALGGRMFGTRALGQRLFIDGRWRQVVGIVADVTEVGEVSAGVIRRPGLRRITLPAAYVPPGSIDCSTHFLLARTDLDTAGAAAVVQRAVQAIEPTGTIRKSGWLDDRVAAAGAEARFCALTVGVFAGAALLLGGIGVFGVVSNAARERTLEMGIRAALGAGPGRLAWTIAGSIAAAVIAGGAVGLAVVLAGGRLIRAFLFEVTPTDPWSLGFVAVLLLVIAGLAAYLPIRAVTRLGPAHALRAD